MEKSCEFPILSTRKSDEDFGGFTELRIDFDSAPVGVDDPAGDAQAETAAILIWIVSGIGAKERFENLLYIFRGDAGAGVEDAQLGSLAALNERKFDAAVHDIMFNGIVGEIEQELAQSITIAV